MSLEITNQIRIQDHPDFWYTVEDIYLDVGSSGCTISYCESRTETGEEKRINHICMDEKTALAVANAIYKLFKS
jgi:hypothetical protein